MDLSTAAIAEATAPCHEPQAASASPASEALSTDHLLLFDDLEELGDTGAAAARTPLEATSSGLSIPAHDALMAFLAEMEALEEEQQSNDGSSNSSNTETVETTADTTGIPATTNTPSAHGLKGEVLAAAEKEHVANRQHQVAARSDSRKPAYVVVRPPSGGVSTITTTSSSAKPEKKRIRAKQEIDMLREDAEVLQHHLEALQSTSAPSSTFADGAASKPSKKPKLRHTGAVEQNRKLRKLVRTQLRYAKQIETLLTSNNPDNEEQSILISDNAITKTPLSKADLVVFYEALTGKLDELYAQLDDVFADAKLHTSQHQVQQEFSDAKLVIDDEKHVTLQLRDVKTLPFSFESVKDVSLRLLKAQSVKEGDGVDELLVADEDVMLMRRGMVVQLGEGEPEVEIPMRAVSKKFLSKDRMVFCWDGTTDWPAPPQVAKDQPQSVPLREKGWAVIKPVPGVPGLCTMQMCLLMSPGVSDERVFAIVSRQDIEEGITKFVIPTYQQAFVSRYQMVENMLLDEQRR